MVSYKIRISFYTRKSLITVKTNVTQFEHNVCITYKVLIRQVWNTVFNQSFFPLMMRFLRNPGGKTDDYFSSYFANPPQ